MINNPQFTEGWPSRILTGEIEDRQLVDQLVAHILTNYNLSSSSANVNTENLFSDPFFDEFKNKIVIPAFDYWLKNCLGISYNDVQTEIFMRAWITGAHNGYSIMSHNHSGAHLSAVFYLLNDAPEAGGEIVFFDPRGNANRGYKPHWNHFFAPERMTAPAYTFAVFPSFIYHQTTPFNGNIRLAVPVDLFI